MWASDLVAPIKAWAMLYPDTLIQSIRQAVYTGTIIITTTSGHFYAWEEEEKTFRKIS
jgi:hypothetical protein